LESLISDMNPRRCCSVQQIRLFLRIVRITVTIAPVLFMGCSKSPENSPGSTAVGDPKLAVQTKVSQGPLECPGALASQPTGHKVLLTWKASASSTGPNDKSLGYCVYRSDHKIIADTLEGCRECQKITPIPIFGTACVDDFGHDSNTYYYAAVTLDPKGKRSKFSNKTSASFTGKRARSQFGNDQTYPACRPSRSFIQAPPATSLPRQ